MGLVASEFTLSNKPETSGTQKNGPLSITEILEKHATSRDNQQPATFQNRAAKFENFLVSEGYEFTSRADAVMKRKQSLGISNRPLDIISPPTLPPQSSYIEPNIFNSLNPPLTSHQENAPYNSPDVFKGVSKGMNLMKM